MLPSANELKERYASWSNKRLLSVLHKKEQYTSQAVEIARSELGQRNITAEELDRFLEEMELQKTTQKMLSRISLTFWEKLLCFFVWFLPRASIMNYSRNGFLLKVKQSESFAISGFVSHMIVGFATVHFDLPVTQGIGTLLLFFVFFFLGEKSWRYIF